MGKIEKKEQRDTKGDARSAMDGAAAMKQVTGSHTQRSLSPNKEHNANKASLGPNTKR